MDRTSISLTYGKNSVDLTVPTARLAAPLVAPREPAALSGTPVEVFRAALDQPVDRPLLRELVGGEAVGLVVSDEFRAGLQEEIAEALLAEIAAGGPKQVRVFFATGTHDPKVYTSVLGPRIQALAKKIGLEVQLVANDCDNSDFVDLGHTSRGVHLRVNRLLLECKVRVYGHESKYHYMCGYSNMDKQLLPGFSSRKTVEGNHKLALSLDSGPGRSPWHADPARHTNPFAQDAQEARQTADNVWVDDQGNLVEGVTTTFALDMISSGDKVYWVQAGDPAAVSREMTAQADQIAMFAVKPSRYVVVSPGGPPASQAMYGIQNCFDMALKGAIQEGGEALIVAPADGRPDLPEEVSGLAPDPKSKKLFWDNLCRLKDQPLEEACAWIDENFELYLWKTDRVLKLMNGKDLKLYVHSELPAEKLEEGGFFAAPDAQAWIDERAARDDGQFVFIDNGNKLLVVGEE